MSLSDHEIVRRDMVAEDLMEVLVSAVPLFDSLLEFEKKSGGETYALTRGRASCRELAAHIKRHLQASRERKAELERKAEMGKVIHAEDLFKRKPIGSPDGSAQMAIIDNTETF